MFSFNSYSFGFTPGLCSCFSLRPVVLSLACFCLCLLPRRLFYVGVTRARKCLVLSTTSGSCSKDLNVDLSRPLDETKLVPSQIEACDDELTPMAVAGLMDDDSISSVCLDQKVLGVSTCYPSSFLENIHVSLLPVLSLQTYPWCQPLFEESNGGLCLFFFLFSFFSIVSWDYLTSTMYRPLLFTILVVFFVLLASS